MNESKINTGAMRIYIIFTLILLPVMGWAQVKGDTSKQLKDTLTKSVKLEEVVIKAKKPLVQMEMDKTVINVESMIGSASSNTMEVLEKTPGVTVDARGNISLNGRSGVMVLIDGRQTYLSGADLASYLKSVPGANLEKIELMDNPPARYDAAGNGVINIRLKKTRAGGLTGSASAGYVRSQFNSSNQALNLNYNYKKINIFSNLGHSVDQNYTADFYDRSYFGNQSSRVLLNTREQARTGAANVNLGVDYAVSKNTSLGFQGSTNFSRRQGELHSDSRNFSLNNLDSTGKGYIDFGNKRRNLIGNLNVLQKFSKSGAELSAEAGYLQYNNIGDATLQNSVFQPNDLLLHTDRFLYDLPNSIQVYTLKSDYIHPLKKKRNVEAGMKWSKVRNDNPSDHYILKNGEKIIDNSRSNHFIYLEDNLAAYLSGQTEGKRWGLKTGLRAEYTSASGRQLGNSEVAGSSFTNRYMRLFPSLFINFKLDTTGANSLNFSITRRINRPNYHQLNPFVTYVDQYSYNSGNPELNPQYQYRYEIRYQHKQFFRTGLSYNHFTDIILRTTNVIDGVYFNKPENVSSGYMLLLSTWISLDPAKWWNVNSDILLSRIGLTGDAYGERLNTHTFVARLNLVNRLDLGKGWNAELGCYYASRDLNGQALTAGMFRANSALRKKLWKDKASIRLSMDDMFHSWKQDNRSFGLRQSAYIQTQESDSRRMGIAFTYSFGNELFAKKSRQKNNALDEEKSRL